MQRAVRRRLRWIGATKKNRHWRLQRAGLEPVAVVYRLRRAKSEMLVPLGSASTTERRVRALCEVPDFVLTEGHPLVNPLRTNLQIETFVVPSCCVVRRIILHILRSHGSERIRI